MISVECAEKCKGNSFSIDSIGTELTNDHFKMRVGLIGSSVKIVQGRILNGIGNGNFRGYEILELFSTFEQTF
jgi:hypothetical protein